MYITNQTKPTAGLINWSLPLFIILASYPLLSINVGYILLLLISAYYFIVSRELCFNKYVLLYPFIGFIIQFIIHRNSSLSGPSGLTILLTLIFICCLASHINERKLFQVYKVLGSLAMVGILYHVIIIYVFSTPVQTIKLLPIELPIDYAGRDSLRPVSFFVEPQAYASFIIPFLFLALKRSNNFWAVLISISILLSTSSQGIIMAIVLWVNDIYNKRKSKKSVITLIVFTILGILLSSTQIFDFAIEKILSIDLSGDVRIVRGFLIWFEMPPQDKLLGVGYGMDSVRNYVQNLGVFDWAIGNERAGYTSGFSGLLIQFGYIGFIFMLFMFFSLFKKSSRYNRGFVVMVFIVSFSQNLVYNAWFVYFIMFILVISPGTYKIIKLGKSRSSLNHVVYHSDDLIK